jgi:hypothetical protein
MSKVVFTDKARRILGDPQVRQQLDAAITEAWAGRKGIVTTTDGKRYSIKVR